MEDDVIYVDMPKLARRFLSQNVTPKELIVIMSVCKEAADNKDNMFSRTKQEIGKRLNVNQNIVRSAIDKMVLSDVARKVGRGKWMVNPCLSFGHDMRVKRTYSKYAELGGER